jgi:hypothetical protein
MNSKPYTYLRYRRENDQVYVLSDGSETHLVVPKNRTMPDSFFHSQAQPLTPAFRLLGLAVLGLAPAGLGTLILAPLAMLWTIVVFFKQPLVRADRIRAAIVVGLSIGLLGLAVPLSLLFLARLS